LYFLCHISDIDESQVTMAPCIVALSSQVIVGSPMLFDFMPDIHSQNTSLPMIFSLKIKKMKFSLVNCSIVLNMVSDFTITVSSPLAYRVDPENCLSCDQRLCWATFSCILEYHLYTLTSMKCCVSIFWKSLFRVYVDLSYHICIQIN